MSGVTKTTNVEMKETLNDRAEKIIGKELPVPLDRFLADIEHYAKAQGGSIESRQVLALAIAVYYHFKSKSGI